MSRTLELYCLVVGDEPSSLFPVKVESTESVGTLKDMIKKKKEPLFDLVPADTLVLWKVSIFSDDDGLQRRIEDLNLVEEQSLRRPAARLSKIFSDPVEDEHVHILVRPPRVRECSSLWLSVFLTKDLRQIPPRSRLWHLSVTHSSSTVCSSATIPVTFSQSKLPRPSLLAPLRKRSRMRR